jgi:SAM-dependent methyltransferase
MADVGAQERDSAVAHDDWDDHWTEYGEANERNPAQDYRRALCLFLLGRRGRPSRLLDIGSGNGELLAAAASRWPEAELAGLELSPAGVAASERKVPAARVRVCDLLESPEPECGEHAWASHAVCSEVLEHVDDPVALLRNARRWLAPGCRLVLTVPGGPMSAFDRHIGHRRHFSPADLRQTLTDAGLDVAMTAGAGFPMFDVYRSMVILAGDRLISAGNAEAEHTMGGVMLRLAMLAFQPLFRLNLPRSPLGWQTIGVAREPLAAG